MAEIEKSQSQIENADKCEGRGGPGEETEHFTLPSRTRLKREMWHCANLPPATWRHDRMVCIDVSNEYLT